MKKMITELAKTVACIAFAIGVAWLLTNFVAQRVLVDGSSMENTFKDGDYLTMDKISYHFKEPERFDIVVFYAEKDTAKYIKRIIGLPGETVYINEFGKIYINDKELEENYGREVINSKNRGLASSPVTLKENEYFVLGDNRNNSIDSRSEAVGNVSKDIIIGKILFY